MSRFFIIVSLLLSLYLAWWALNLFLAPAHSISGIRFAEEILDLQPDGEKPAAERMTLVRGSLKGLRQSIERRNAIDTHCALAIATVAALQFCLTLWLAHAGAFWRPVGKAKRE